jgi:hypothetical protein
MCDPVTDRTLHEPPTFTVDSSSISQVGAVDGVLHLAGLADLQYVAQVRRVGSLCYALRLAVLYAVSPTQRTRALVGRWAAHDSAKKSFEFSALFPAF